MEIGEDNMDIVLGFFLSEGSSRFASVCVTVKNHD
jgi:hypothetical protein